MEHRAEIELSIQEFNQRILEARELESQSLVRRKTFQKRAIVGMIGSALFASGTFFLLPNLLNEVPIELYVTGGFSSWISAYYSISNSRYSQREGLAILQLKNRISLLESSRDEEQKFLLQHFLIESSPETN